MTARLAIAVVSILAIGCSSAPTAPGSTATSPADGNVTAPTQAPVDGPAGGTQVVLEVGGRSITLPDVALCLVTDEQVEISASAAGGTTGVTVSWRADQPPAQTSIVYLDLGLPGTFVAGPDVSAESPPQVTVSGTSVEIVAELHDPSLGRPSVSIRLLASCPESAGDDVPFPDEPSVSGRGSVTVGGTTHEFDIAEQCDIGEGSIGVNLSDADGNHLSVVAIGPTAFMTMNVDGEQWQAGLTGVPMEFVIRGSSASWSGTLAQADTSTQSPASLEVTCGG